jgi:sugar phosphate permease
MIAALVRGRIHYGWMVVAVTFVTMLIAAGVRSVPGVLILPLEGEFGWSRPTISLAISINLVLYGLCGPFASAAVERLGLRRIMVFALLLIAGAAGLTTLMRSAWQLMLLWGIVVGLGSGALAGWVTATVSNRWFANRRGLVVGVLTAAGSTGQLLFLPLVASLTESLGWRGAVMFVTVAALAIAPLVFLVMRDHPEDVGLQHYGADPDVMPQTGTEPTAGNPVTSALRTLRSCLRSRDFLLLAGSFFVCGASTNGLIGTHLIPASVEHGMPEVQAASFLAIIGLFDVVGTLASGWLSDRFDNRVLLAWYYGLRGLSLLFLPFAFDAGLLSLGIFVVFYGLDWVATVPPTVRLAADLFGKRQAGTVFAWIFASHQLGAATIAFVAGALRASLGDYQASFISAGLLCLVAVGMVVSIGRSRTDLRASSSADRLLAGIRSEVEP